MSSVLMCVLRLTPCIHSNILISSLVHQSTILFHCPAFSSLCFMTELDGYFLVTYCITRYFRGRKFSRKANLRYFRGKIFSRIYCSRENIFPRKYLPAKISPAKISSLENIFPRKYLPRIVSVPQICRLVGLGYAVYYSITYRPLPN